MLKVSKDGSIKLTRGDSACLVVPIELEDSGTAYEMQPGDVLKLSLKISKNDNEPVLQKVVTGSNVFYIKPDDTKKLEFKKYKYDVEITTESGEVYTVIPYNTFEITAEVT